MTTLVDAPTATRTPRTALLNGPFLAIELRRLLRNRRTVIFTLIMPPAFFLIFGTADVYTSQSVGNGNVTAFIMVSMALYGAMLATTSGGASVSVERSQGWTRQLRLTPLRPATYVFTKVLVAMVMGLAAVVVVAIVWKVFPSWFSGMNSPPRKASTARTGPRICMTFSDGSR
jgi:ABC-2 type transport system permease protein